MMSINKSLFLGLLTTLMSCSSSNDNPKPLPIQDPAVLVPPSPELRSGSDLYENLCENCHGPVETTRLRNTQYPELNEVSGRPYHRKPFYQLGDNELRSISLYLSN